MANFGPGLAGWYGAEAARNQNTGAQISQLGGLLGIQNQMFEQQLNPLKLQQLQMAVDRARLNNQLVQGIQGGGQPAPSPAALGEGGISTPGGGQANLRTGQAIPAGQAPQGSPMGGIPPQVMGMLVSGDPGLMAVGKAILEGQKPVNVRPGGTVYIPGQGPQYTAPGTNGTQITYGPQGPQQSVIPGVVQSQAALGQTPGQWVTNADQTKSWVPTAQLAGAAMNNPIPQAPQATPQVRPQVGPINPASNAAPSPREVALAGRSPAELQAISDVESGRVTSARVPPEQLGQISRIPGPPRFGQTQEEQIRQAGMTAANTEAGKEFIKEQAANFAKLRDVPASLANIEKAKSLAAGSAAKFMGPLGETKLEITKFLRGNVPGMATLSTPSVTGAEEIRAALFNQVMDNLKKMDAQPSQYQQQVMQDAFGKLGTDPAAIPDMLNIFGDILRQKVDIHNQTVTSAESRGTTFPYDIKIKLPEKSEGLEAQVRASGIPYEPQKYEYRVSNGQVQRRAK